ncbi:PQQ-binding-like beta-propeller repeat protein [Streptomyces sp. CoH27]|uniref:outer membrane protein assembly factor BamB family protein n=1 Tax=Streptomyces sp. CoH27 TaxID=2875763 RepID=UPI0027E19430|nr:PQQ-binding-like beta-propeller repeat protein [Streptomyces sp. CoH27]
MSSRRRGTRHVRRHRHAALPASSSRAAATSPEPTAPSAEPATRSRPAAPVHPRPGTGRAHQKADGTVCFGAADGNLHAADAGTGRYRRRLPVQGTLPGRPATAAGTVYLSSTSRLLAVDAATGRKRRALTDSGTWSPPAVANGVLYAGSSDHHLYTITP